MGIEILRPSGDGTLSQLATHLGGDHYVEVDEVTPDGYDTYVFRDWTAKLTDTYVIPNHSVGWGTINHVRIICVYQPAAQGADKKAWTALYTNAVLHNGAEHNNDPVAWNTISDIWTTNPETGSAWTWAEIDALEIGVSLQSDEGTEVACTQVYAEVDYTPSRQSGSIGTMHIY